MRQSNRRRFNLCCRVGRSARAAERQGTLSLMELLESRKLLSTAMPLGAVAAAAGDTVFASSAGTVLPNIGIGRNGIEVAGLQGVIEDINVTINLSHSHTADLDLHLVNTTTGSAVLLAGREGNGGHFSSTTFDDEAVSSIIYAASPCTGRFKPEELLSAFDGEDPNGTWYLQGIDRVNNSYVGTIQNWSIDIHTHPETTGRTLTTTVFTSSESMAIYNAGWQAAQMDITGLSGPIRDLDLTVNLHHGHTADLEVYLVNSKTGSAAYLVGREGNDSDFALTTFDDEAASSIVYAASPCTGRFKPEELLSAFDGEDPNGTWYLLIGDVAANASEGSLQQWQLRFKTDIVPPLPPESNTKTTTYTHSSNQHIYNLRRLEVPIEVTDNAASITDLDVSVQVAHPHTADLNVYLRHETTGTTVCLAADEGNGGNMLFTTFDDQSDFSIIYAASPCTGRYVPEQPLSAFNGENVGGRWTLIIDDDTANTSEGVLESWSMRVTTSLNAPPSDIRLGSGQVAENRPAGTVVGTLSASDPDASDPLTFSLVEGQGSQDNHLFTIMGNQLRLAASLNYEQAATRSVRIRATDRGGLSVEQVFTIAVEDLQPCIGLRFGDELITPDSVCNLGSVQIGQAAASATFCVENIGQDTLELNHVTMPEGYVITEMLATSLQPGESDSFTVRLSADRTGRWNGSILIDSNDPLNRRAAIAVTGQVQANPAASLAVSGRPRRQTLFRNKARVVKFAIRNTGRLAANGKAKVTCYLSRDGQLDGRGEFAVQAPANLALRIAPGKTQNVSLSLALPPGTAAKLQKGNHTLLVRLTGIGSLQSALQSVAPVLAIPVVLR